MVASTLVDLVKVNISSIGAGTLTLGTAVSGFRGIEALTDGLTYSYSIRQNGNYEYGQGVYTTVGASMTRSVIGSSNGGFAIALTSGAIIAFALLAEDIAYVASLAQNTTDQLAQGSTNKYFANSLARAALSAGPGIGYDNSTGVISLPRSPIHLIVEGDSKALQVGNMGSRSALYYALARFPRDLYYDPTLDNLAVGSTVSDADASDPPHGLISTGRLASMTARIAAVAALGHRPVVVLKIGANDTTTQYNNDNGVGSTLANVEKAWNTYKAAGAVYCIIMSIDPRVITATQAGMFLGVNRGFKEYARQNREVFFCDSQVALADQSSLLYGPLGGGAQTPGCVMYDNPPLHESAYGAYLQSIPLSDCLALIAPPRTQPQVTVPSDVYNNPTTPNNTTANQAIRGNLLGKQGRFYDTGGVIAQVSLSGGSGVSGISNFPSAKLFTNNPSLTGTMSGTMAVAISQVAYPPYVTAYGRSDIMATRLTFSGTPSAAGTVKALATVLKPTNFDYTVPFQADADFYATALAGVTFGLTATVATGRSLGGPSSPASNADALLPITGRFTPYFTWNLIAPSDPANMVCELRFDFFAGVPVSGTVDIFGMSIVENPTLPAPTT